MSGDMYLARINGEFVQKTSVNSGTADPGNAGTLVALGSDGKIAGALLNPVAGSASILAATVTLNRADILALNATPFDLVAAPGANKINILIAMVLKYTFGVAAYAAGGNLTAIYESDALLEAGGAGIANTMLQAAADRIAFIGSSTDLNGKQGPAATTDGVNDKIQLKSSVAYTDAGGTSTGTLTVTTYYITVDV